jgi:hypothetical protein
LRLHRCPRQHRCDGLQNADKALDHLEARARTKLNAANTVAVDSLADHADAVVHLGELVEAARLSVRAAIRMGEELDVERSRHRTGLHEHRGRT